MARPKTEKAPNYSEEATAELIQRYQAGESVDALASAFVKSKRSVIAKLVREGVYVAPEKPKASAREEGPTKKEMLRELAGKVPFDVTGFENATKEAIASVIALADELAEMSASDSDESEGMAEAA